MELEPDIRERFWKLSQPTNLFRSRVVNTSVFYFFYTEDGLNEVNRQLSHCPNFNRQPSRMQDFYRRIPKIVLNSK